MFGLYSKHLKKIGGYIGSTNAFGWCAWSRHIELSHTQRRHAFKRGVLCLKIEEIWDRMGGSSI
jgi:hypothetical protein